MGSTRGGGTVFAETTSLPRPKFGNLLQSEPSFTPRSSTTTNEDDNYNYSSTRDSSASPISADNSPYNMSPWNNPSPFAKSPWTRNSPITPLFNNFPHNGLIGSLVREEGHIYSLAASGDLLYTGSDSKNIRVWKNRKELAGFKSNSGLVKAIVVSTKENKIFTGHQDGKIRVWKVSDKNPSVHKRIGALPKLKDFIKSSIKPSNYVQVRRNRNALWIKHFDVVSCLSLDEEQGLLYSGSWDKTLKVWRISDSKCLESINAHDDALNSVVFSGGVDGLVFTGSADGTAKAWRREYKGKGTKHVLWQTLLKQESAVTSLAISPSRTFIYCGSSDGLVNFWVRAKMQLAHGGALRGHKQAMLCLATAGNLVFSGSADKTICVWRREGGLHSCLSVLTGHSGPVKCLAVERDQGQQGGDDHDRDEDQRWILYSGSLDKSVKVWRMSEQIPDFQHRQRLQELQHLSPRGSRPSLLFSPLRSPKYDD